MKARSRLRAASARRSWTAGSDSRARRRSSSWRTRRFMFPAAAAVAEFRERGGSVREGDGHDGFHGRAGGDDLDHAVHQRGGLARAGGGFHHPTAVEIGDGDGGHAAPSGRWWGGPPGPRGSPWTRFSPPESASSMESTPTGASAADQGVRPTILGKLYVIASLAILSSLSARLAIFP